MPQDTLLRACHSAAVDPTATDGTWVLLLPAGTWRGRDGRGPYAVGDVARMAAIVEATKAYHGATDIVVDYDHQTEFGAVPGVGGRAPAAGWVKALDVRPDGIWGQITWTAAAREHIRAGEYRYLSPVYFHAKQTGEIKALRSVGLLNIPNLDLGGAVAARAMLTEPEGEPMKSVAKALGLAEDATEDQILVAVQSTLAAVASVAQAAGLAPTAPAADMVVAIQSAAAAKVDPTKFVPIDVVTAMQAQLKTLTDGAAEKAATEAVDAAIAAGKLTPAQRDWGLAVHKANPAFLANFVASAPVLVQPGGGGYQVAAQSAAGAGGLTETDRAVMSAMGQSEEDFLKARKQEAR